MATQGRKSKGLGKASKRLPQVVEFELRLEERGGLTVSLIVSTFSIPAISYNKFKQLKQHKGFILQLWISEIPHMSHRAQIKVLEGCVPFLRLWEDAAFLPIAASRGLQHSLP